MSCHSRWFPTSTRRQHQVDIVPNARQTSVIPDCELCPAALRSLTRYDETTDWQKKLTPEEYVVTRERGTEVVSILTALRSPDVISLTSIDIGCILCS